MKKHFYRLGRSAALISAFLLATVGVLFMACRTPTSDTPTPDTAVAFTGVSADGSATTATTTKLTLTFDQAITDLAADDITLTGSGVTKGALTSTATAGKYELAVSVTAGGTVTVAVEKSGYTISGSPITVTVHYYVAPGAITAAFINLIADGNAATATTTKLTLTFDKAITGLAAGDITLNAGSTGANRGTLTSTGTAGVYELTVSGIIASGTVTVSAAKTGYNISGGSKTVNVYYYDDPEDIAAEFTGLTADGSASVTTTKLTLTFSQAITDLSVDDITLTGSAGAAKDALISTATDGVYELAVTVTADGTVTVSAAKDGYVITPASKDVAVFYYAAPIAVTFNSAIADGSTTATTTKLTLAFDKDITGFEAGDIDLIAGTTGAVKGALTSTGTAGVYELAVTVTASGSVTVTVAKDGYTISDDTKSVQVHYVVAAAFTGLTANGSATTATTTKLTLTFDKAITGLAASDITLTGAIRGTLAPTGTDGVYELGVGGITADGTVTVAVSKSGYVITPASKDAAVYYYLDPSATPVAFSGLTADGGLTTTTTKLTLTFDQDITGLAAGDIILDDGDTNAVIDTLTPTGSGVYELAVSGITASGPVTVAVSKPGYTITPPSKGVTVTFAPPKGELNIPLSIVDQGGSLTLTGNTAFTVYWTGADGSKTVSVSTEGYTYTWYVDGVSNGTGDSITIRAVDYSIGKHQLVLAAKDVNNVIWTAPAIAFTVLETQ
ncbi:hypothetical protein FACS1894124_2180 [Spirochaetia bacterium]|nr:hypothetical protein FACS1894124_2180 [Spirochaetia bacterium]